MALVATETGILFHMPGPGYGKQPQGASLSRVQGAVPGIKEYAALHAVKEEAVRESKALTDVLKAASSSSEEAKARRDFSEATRSKVMAAAEQQVALKQRRAQLNGAGEVGADAPAEATGPSGDSPAKSMEEMQQQRKALLSAGFDVEAEKIASQLAQLRSSAEKERVDLEQQLFKQRLAELEASQREQRERLAVTQATELAEAETGWRDEIAALTAMQAQENQEFELRIARAAALEEVELPRQLLKHRYKPSAKLYNINEKIARLPDDLTQANATVSKTKARLQQQQKVLEREEVEKWRVELLSAALGPEPTSCIGQMLSAHKFSYDKAVDRQLKQRHEFIKAQEEARKALEASFRVAVWSAKKQAAAAFEAEHAELQESPPSSPLPVPDIVALWKGKTKRDSTGMKHISRDVETKVPATGAERSCDDGLTAWIWMNNLQEVLLKLTSLEGSAKGEGTNTEGPRLLDPLLSHIASTGGAALEQRLKHALEINRVARMTDPREQEEAACGLYELLNQTIVPANFDMETMHISLAANAAQIRREIEPAFVSFLGTPGCSALIQSLRELAESFRHERRLQGRPSFDDGEQLVPLTNVKVDGLIKTLEKHEIAQSVSVVDLNVPGLPLMYVNDAWEALTGYSSSEVIGLNAQLLQGESTEEVAVSRMVQAIRESRGTLVCVSNYRKDGTRFRHSLSLHPLCDEFGMPRYMISVGRDADEVTDDPDPDRSRSVIQTVRRLIPKSFPLASEPKPLSLENALRLKRDFDHDHLNNLMALFTGLICHDNPYRSLCASVRSPSVFNHYTTAHQASGVFDRKEEDTCLTNLQLMKHIAEMAQLEGPKLQEQVDRLWDQLRSQPSPSEPTLETPSQAEALGSEGALIVAQSDSPPRILCSSLSLTPEARAKHVSECLQLAERHVADSHWLEHVQKECNTLRLFPKQKTSMGELAKVMAPDHKMHRATIADKLWTAYTVLDDAASFLTAVVHWANQSNGCVTVSDVLLPGKALDDPTLLRHVLSPSFTRIDHPSSNLHVVAGAPLIYVNEPFAELCGYAREEVHGHNMRFMQGPETEPEAVASISECIRTGVICHMRLTNYRKDGSTFCNLLALQPVHDSLGVLRFVIGVQSEVTLTNDKSFGPRSSREGELSAASERKLEWQRRVLENIPSIMITRGNPIGPVHAEKLELRAQLPEPHKNSERVSQMIVDRAAYARLNHRPMEVGDGSEAISSDPPIERASRGEVVVPGASWMIAGAAFVGEHQRMLDHVQNSDVSAKLDTHTEHREHMVKLTRLSWLQPRSGMNALRELLPSVVGTEEFRAYIVRACPRLLRQADELMSKISAARINATAATAEAKAGDSKEGDATPTADELPETLAELLGPELLLGWAAFLSSDECSRLLICLEDPSMGTSAEGDRSVSGSFKRANSFRRLGGKSPKLLRRMSIDNLEIALGGAAKKASSIPGLLTSDKNSWLSTFINATARLEHAVSVVDISVAGLRACCLLGANPYSPALPLYSLSFAARLSVVQR